ncbi:peptidyl-prolyl cis-trans isomerase [Marinihelvus fidelis]|uniref:peptidylprolyl isomerase n=1 Tax=Marinihelvus fidelis TaxID=2613842 RepID=A0A5N0TFU1_9GAMM|nr:peptidylprolyl isomerase [Marinihelvus fidelis]KAA9134013.1 peptidyl-prolyl cis-trans isomerase [Marinihelvus fidelis]
MSDRRWLREPLLHFFLIGALLFVLFGWVNRGETVAEDVIVVDDDRVSLLAMQFERVWMRPPTAAEMDGLVDKWVRDEILYREGVAMGLDQNDPVFRRRVAQKMTFIAEGAVNETPTEAELQAWLDERPEQYRAEPALTFRQVYFQGDGAARADAIEQALAALEDGTVAEALGDPSLLPQRMDAAGASRVDAMFGDGFVATLQAQATGEWVGPVESAFGTHLVFVEQVTPSRAVTLDEVRQAVQRDLMTARREQAEDAFVDALRQKYTVQLPVSAP